MNRILLVDDNSVSLSLAREMLADTYSVAAVLSGSEAVKYLQKKETDLILLDINMPDMTGFDTLRALRENPATENLPIIFLTSENDPEIELRCFEEGAMDFISKPFRKATLRARVGRAFEVINARRDMETRLTEKTREIARLSLKSMMLVANTVDRRDPSASHHSTNVAWFAVEIARKLNWSADDIYNLQNLALVHDIGKIAVPDSILRKPAPLTPDESNIVKKHTTFGRDILREMNILNHAAEAAESHHERYDGKGYPAGLAGEAIPIEARIIAVADALDAMTSDRSFRKKLSIEEMIGQFTAGRGTQFDPALADIAMELIRENRISPDLSEAESGSDSVLDGSRLLQKVLQEYTREIRSEAQRDPLTGLWNRNYTSEVVNEYLSDKRHNGCFMMIDIDSFKTINDTFGHIVGDRVIEQFAHVLQSCIRSDDILCRIGGDEFVIFLKGTPSRSFAASKAEAIIREIGTNVGLPDGGHASVSIGIATAPVDGVDFDTLYVKADKALYHVKENGKHSFHFFSDDARPLLHNVHSTRIDLEYLRRFISRPAFSDERTAHDDSESFRSIYRFLVKAQDISEKPMQMLLLTLTDTAGEAPAGELLEDALGYLKDALIASVGDDDLVIHYSSSQYLSIIVDSTYAGAYLVAEKVRRLFYESAADLGLKLTYDIDTSPRIRETILPDELQDELPDEPQDTAGNPADSDAVSDTSPGRKAPGDSPAPAGSSSCAGNGSSGIAR